MTTQSLSILTWNLAMLARSEQAPASWTDEHALAAIREFALELKPDVILLQELPSLVPYVETHGMVRANPVTHSGNLATLLSHNLMETGQPEARVVERTALLTVFRPLGLTIANVHLTPGRGGAASRLDQMAKIVDASPTAHLIVGGDTNSRLDEVPAFEELGLGGDRPPTPTWNSRRNRFHADMPEFSAYFTRYFATEGVSLHDVQVWEDAQVEHDGRAFQLSDHYALTARATWSTDHG